MTPDLLNKPYYYLNARPSFLLLWLAGMEAFYTLEDLFSIRPGLLGEFAIL
jgi:hypothetical protein